MTPGIVQHNIPAMNAYMNYSSNVKSLAGNLQKLSSAYRINSAADDAAGLAISEKMRAQITGLEVAQKNAKDGISLVQTAEGALTEVHSMLNRMVTLAEQSANGTYADDLDREQLQKEIDSLSTEINRIANSSNFNGIKLLDGSLGAKTVDSIEIIDDVPSVDYGDGIDVTNDAGLGAQSKFEITFDQAFSEDDTITLNFNVPTASGGSVAQSLTLTSLGTGTGQGSSTGAGAANFKGVTIEDQLNSIKETLLNGNNTLSNASVANAVSGNLNTIFGTGANQYSVTVDGNKLIIEANDEAATGKLSLTSVSTTNKDAGVAATPTAGVDGSGASNTTGVVKDLIGGTNLQAGDSLKFNFKLANGTTTSATVNITEEMITDIGDSGASLTSQIVEKLKNASFDDSAVTTGIDESQYKVSDFFDITANNDGNTTSVGSLKIVTNTATAKNAASGDFELTDVQLSRKDQDNYSDIRNYSATVTTNANTYTAGSAAKGKTDYDFTGGKNFAEGDTFTISGTLVDGRNFSVTLTAGKTPSGNTFEIGANVSGSVANITSALQSSSVKVSVGSDGDQISASEIFTGSNKQFDVSDASGVLTIENASVGVDGTKGVTGRISSGVLSTKAAEASGEQTVAGVDTDSAKITLTFKKEDLEYGTAVTIGEGTKAKTFELVASDDATVTSEGNIRVVVSDLESATQNAIVDAFRDAINNELVNNYKADTNDAGSADTYKQWAVDLIGQGSTMTTSSTYGTFGNYLATVNGNTITLKSVHTGSDAEKMGAKNTYGLSEGIGLDLATNEDGSFKLKAGDTVKINGDTYQFDTSTRNLQGNNKLIRVEAGDFGNKEAVAKAIKLAVEEEDPSVTVRINDDNSVILSAAYYNGKYVTPTAEKDVTGNGGLKLQIGDTSDDFNRMTVSINDMHTDAMGISGISVLTQDDAAAAIDQIKAAINYVSDVRGTLGATQNRLDHTINNLSVMQTNIQDAESAIRDTDVAAMMMEYTKNNIKVQAAQAMLAQANQLPQGVLQMMG